MTADRVDLPEVPEEGRLLRATLITLILVLSSGMLFGAMSSAREREDEIEEAHERALRTRGGFVSEHLNLAAPSADQQEAPPADAGQGEDGPQGDPS